MLQADPDYRALDQWWSLCLVHAAHLGSKVTDIVLAVQEKWDKDLYIGSVAWGPMVN